MQEWQRSLLHAASPALLQKWREKLEVRLNGYFLQRMKTKWAAAIIAHASFV